MFVLFVFFSSHPDAIIASAAFEYTWALTLLAFILSYVKVRTTWPKTIYQPYRSTLLGNMKASLALTPPFGLIRTSMPFSSMSAWIVTLMMLCPSRWSPLETREKICIEIQTRKTMTLQSFKTDDDGMRERSEITHQVEYR